jgi:hypothetical protein
MELCNVYFDEGKYVIVNTVTGESTELKLSAPKSTTTKKTVKKDENPNPTITLLDNKYVLNQAAVELLGLEPDDKVDIKFEKRGKETIPVIGKDEAFGTHGGNRFTKSNSVSCRGKANEELSKFGTEFSVVEHDTKDGLFILKGDKDIIEDNKIDENIEINDNEDDLLTEALVSDDTEEVTAFDFKL